MLRVVVIASGRGSNFEAIADSIEKDGVDARIVGVVCNVPGAGVIERAEGRGIPVTMLPSKGMVSPEARVDYDIRLGDAIEAFGVDLIVLAGYMRILQPAFIRRFAGRIVNIHPSLLPAFPGLNVHEAVIAHGCKVSGCTVHFVDEGLDSGPIIAQACVPVRDDDTPESLAARIHAAEHRVYPWVVARIAEGKVRVDGRRVTIDAPHPEFHQS